MPRSTKSMMVLTLVMLVVITAYTVALGSSGWLWFGWVVLGLTAIGTAAVSRSS
ncbi:hypothetical protein [Streptomyces sp. NBC_00083]|uniref:hypothetical protein n=1 Tax=Streptomyces sp. NBC_00083 TaxID=2975647 RepID=UPI00224FEE62|nr:hypothetical protein [Streptomyces sp. NBC_00083]MCX5383801.1 hypothetical protein [Streptomyces sp. NBC_00083]